MTTTLKKKHMAQIRWLSIFMAIAVTTLSVEYLCTKFWLFLDSAIALGVFGLTLISLIVNQIIKGRPLFSRRKSK